MECSQRRRALTLGTGLVLGTGGLPGWSVLTARAAPSAPALLTPAQTALVAGLVEVIVPADGSPSAAALGSPAFVIGVLLGSSADGGAGLRQALAGVDGVARQLFGCGFLALAPEQRTRVVEAVALAPDFAAFWSALRRLTVLHYYAQPGGYRDIGLPGPSIDAGGFPSPDTVPCGAATRA